MSFEAVTVATTALPLTERGDRQRVVGHGGRRRCRELQHPELVACGAGDDAGVEDLERAGVRLAERHVAREVEALRVLGEDVDVVAEGGMPRPMRQASISFTGEAVVRVQDGEMSIV